MMTPFSIQNLCMKLRNVKSIKDKIVAEKYTFCVEFEKELGLEKGNYAEDIFDFLYNLHMYKRVFKGNRFNQIISDVFDMNFLKYIDVSQYIQEIYNEMVFLNRDYFFSVFKFDNEDPVKMGESFMKNLNANYEKFMENF